MAELQGVADGNGVLASVAGRGAGLVGRCVGTGGSVVLWAVAIGMAVLLAAANLWLGDLNQDEGWYLYAARLVSQGQVPYVHFASTQGPVMPYTYVLAVPLVERWGLAGGRLFTALIGLLTAGGAAWLAARFGPRRHRGAVALAAFILAGVNVYQSYFTVVVKTYALAGFWLVSGLVACAFTTGRKGPAAAFLAGILLCLAAGTRTSAVAVIPVVLGFLLVAGWKRRAAAPGRWAVALPVCFAIGVLAAAGLVFLPFLVKAPRQLWFALVEYHAQREAGAGLAKLLAYKAGFASRLIQSYAVAAGLAVAGFLFQFLVLRPGRIPTRVAAFDSDGPPPPPAGMLPPALLWVSAAAVTLVHVLAPFPYDDYQAIVHPVLAAALAGFLVRVVSAAGEAPGAPAGERLIRWLLVTVLALSAAASVSSPVNQSWFVGERDRIWWPLKQEPPLVTLRKAAVLVREHSQPGDLLLTQDTYLAVEAGMRLPRGLELGPFSYYPDWSRVKATACHVLNRDMMLELLEGGEAPVAAFSEYGLAIRSPSVSRLTETERRELWGAVERRYRPVAEVEPFGQAGTRLKILLRKP